MASTHDFEVDGWTRASLKRAKPHLVAARKVCRLVAQEKGKEAAQIAAHVQAEVDGWECRRGDGNAVRK